MLGIAAVWSISPVGEAAAAFRGGTFVRPPIMGPMAGPVGRCLVLLSQLDLTDEQRAAITGIVKERSDEIVAVARAIGDKHHALREAVLSEQAEKEIRELASELGDAVGDATVLASDVLRGVRGVLTPEQIEQLETLREARRSGAEWLKEIAKSMAQE
jgi:Spy/CpxP family protein refolding chaperone